MGMGMGMDMASYGHDVGDAGGVGMKLDKAQVQCHPEMSMAGLAMEPGSGEDLDAEGGGARLEYWTTAGPRMYACENASGALEHMMQLSKESMLPGDAVRSCSWRDLTGASRTNSETKVPVLVQAFHGGRVGAGGDIKQGAACIGGQGRKSFKVCGDGDGGDDGDGDEGVAGRQGWEEAAMSQGEDDIPHAQYTNHVQKDELPDRVNHPCQQVDRSSRDPDVDCNVMLGIDNLRQRRSRQDLNINGLGLSEVVHNDFNLGVRSKLGGSTRDHVSYGECQKNQSADRGMTSVDGCGEFLSSGKDAKLAFTCAACGCHRNFHQRMVQVCEEEEEEELMVKAKREKFECEGGGNYYTSSTLDYCDIDRVAHELMAAANGALTLAQDSLCYSEGGRGARESTISLEEHNIMAKISLENLDHIGKVISSTTECLTLLRKRKMGSSRDKDLNKLESCQAHEGGPSSTDASPVITVEKRTAISLLNPPSPGRPFGGGNMGDPPGLIFSEAYGMNNCNIGVPRKLPMERTSHKLKRTRTRISLEQREKLNAFAEKAGWTVVGQRKETIDAACQYIGIEPKTLKYWIHNSKQKWKRQPSQSDDTSKL